MENEYNYERIDAFLEGELQGEELTSFEQELNSNDELVDGVFWAKAIKGGIEKHQKRSEISNLLETIHCDLEEEGAFNDIEEYTEREVIIGKAVQKAIKTDYKKELRDLHLELEKEGKLNVARATGKVKRLTAIRYLAAAAVIGLLLVAGLFYFPRGEQDMFANNFEPYEDVLSGDVEIVLSERGAALDVEALEALQKGLKDYQKENYEQAIPVFEQYLKSSAKEYKEKDVQFYLAVSNLAIGNNLKAIEGFESLLKSEKFKLKTATQWYLALAYLKNGQKDQAKPLLEGLKSNEKYIDKVQKILEGLK